MLSCRGKFDVFASSFKIEENYNNTSDSTIISCLSNNKERYMMLMIMMMLRLHFPSPLTVVRRKHI